jgi:hypothetical protein
MRIGTTTVVVGLALALAGCGGGHAKPRAADTIVTDDSAVTAASDELSPTVDPTPSPTDSPDADDETVQPPIAPPKCPGGTPSVHFYTPEAAMTYLASAWNRNDLAQLCQVTNPNARFLLNNMHQEAVNLRLVSCRNTDVGMYQCIFRHDYPKKMHKKGTGRTWLDVGAADNPGYYMTVFEGCG